MSETLYKVLNEDGSARMGEGKWPLPINGKPGDWLKVEGDLVACQNGLHLCRRTDLVQWLGPTIYIAEADLSEILMCDNKVVVRRARLLKKLATWNERTARLFACDCAERALDRLSDPDPRSVAAIKTARAYADGKATREELTAARAAARAAARDAAWDAAWTAERRWQTEQLFKYLKG